MATCKNTLLLLPLVLGLFLAGCQTTTEEVLTQNVDFNSDSKGGTTSFLDGQVKKFQTYHDEYPEEPKYAIRLCQLSLESGDYKKALGFVEEAREVDEDNPQYDWMEGRIYYAIGNTVRAERAYKEMLRKSGDNTALPHLELGVFYYATQRPSKAQEQLEKCMMKDGSLPEPHYYLGEIATQMRDKKRAVHHFEKYLKLKGKAFAEDVITRLHQLQPELHSYNPK